MFGVLYGLLSENGVNRVKVSVDIESVAYHSKDVSKCHKQGSFANDICSSVDSSADECAEEQAPTDTVILHLLELKSLLVEILCLQMLARILQLL